MALQELFQDVRSETHENRVRIGFLPAYEMWKDIPAVFSEHDLTISGHPVMEDWEDNYMKELAAAACSRGGRVLEVGFGMGISAGYIQSHDIAEHVIIEANRDVFERLMVFAKDAPRAVLPLFGFWQDVTKQIPSGSISGILFDTYPLCEEEIHQNHFGFFHEAFRLLRPGGILTYYSDEISDFSPEHARKLREAGFRNIQKNICRVDPPDDCAYWKSKTIVVPIVTKEIPQSI